MVSFRNAKRGVSYSQAMAEAYASAPDYDMILDTLEFRHASFVTAGLSYAVRIVNDHEPLLATLEVDAPLDPETEVEFTPCRFEMTRQSETDSGSTPEIELQIDNVARILIPYLDAAKEYRSPIEITWRPYMLSDLSEPHVSPPLTLFLRSVSADMNSVVARAGFGNLTNRRFPAIEYTSKKHPGLASR